MMRYKLREAGKRISRDFRKWYLFFLLFFLYDVMVHLYFRAFCPVVILTGFPCPGCGTTRAIICILTGQFQRAWNLNPTAFAWVAFVCWCFYWRYWCGKEIKQLKYIVIMIAICMFLIYVYRMATSFPSYAPMTYTRNNVLWKNIPFYKEWVTRVILRR